MIAFVLLYTIKPYNYLSPVVSGSALKLADLYSPTLNFHPLTTLHTEGVGHTTSDTRPSHFSARNIESWEGLGTRLE